MFHLQGNVTGEVLLCGRPVDGPLLTRISGFVPQQDLTVETLTAKEHLQFMVNKQIIFLQLNMLEEWVDFYGIDTSLCCTRYLPLNQKAVELTD
jgi:ABC-type multidrug transport system ATPase subunit